MVHEAAFADQSRALRVLMQGEMSEGSAGQAKWEDVDIKTFVRFTQFVYNGRLFDSENDREIERTAFFPRYDC